MLVLAVANSYDDSNNNNNNKTNSKQCTRDRGDQGRWNFFFLLYTAKKETYRMTYKTFNVKNESRKIG